MSRLRGEGYDNVGTMFCLSDFRKYRDLKIKAYSIGMTLKKKPVELDDLINMFRKLALLLKEERALSTKDREAIATLSKKYQ